MKLISINIQNNLHNDIVLKFLQEEKPDIICMQELLEEDFSFFKEALHLDGVYCPQAYIRGITYPELKGKREGVAILASQILNSGYVFYNGSEENILLPFDRYMSDEEFRKNNAFVWAETEMKNGSLFKLATIHPPVTEKATTTPYQLEVIKKLLGQLENLGEIILAGDTNAPRGKEAFAMIAEKYKDNIPQEYTTSIDQNLHRVKGLQNMVDGLFTTSSYTVKSAKLMGGLSDHMAIVAEIGKII